MVIASLLAGPSAVAQSGDTVAAAISTELDALLNPQVTTIHGASIALAEPLREFYSRRSFRPAWTKSQSTAQLFQALTESYEDGLDPADYHLSLLRDLAAQVESTHATASLRAQYDILLTEALLRLSYHLSFGKVDPQSFDAQWNYARTLERIDVTQEIEEAIGTDTVYARVAALKPTHYLYVRLKQALARYRDLEKQGGWSALPAGPAIKPGGSDARVPALRARLELSGDIAQQVVPDPLLYDANLIAAVKDYQARMGLDADGVIGAGTLEELNVPVARRITQLRVNLDRGRVLLNDLPPRFLVVNIPGFAVYLMRGEEVEWSARAQVGRTYRRTPIFRSEINYLVWNPTWTVPPGIIKADILPAARRDPSTITRKGLRVLDSSGHEVPPASVDWSKFSSGHIPYTLRQDPGPDNALGRVKFMFPNSYSVYLHDTPSQALFDRADRAFSSGCVRVENALQLAKLLLDDPQQWDDAAIQRVLASGQLQNVTLKNRIPVLLAYWTAWVDPQGHVNFRRDLYGQDRQWEAGLNAPFRLRAQPLFSGSTASLAQ
jgi:murein L,D-transpeptidase YcbB/YkuD